MSSDLPRSIRSGTLDLFGVMLKVHVLSDGQRVIDVDSMRELLEAMARPSDQTKAEMQVQAEAFARWMRGFDQ